MRENTRVATLALVVAAGFVLVAFGTLRLLETVSPARPALRASVSSFSLEQVGRTDVVLHYRLAIEALDPTDRSTCVVVAREPQGALIGSWPRTVPAMETNRSILMDGSVTLPPWVSDTSLTGIDVGVSCSPVEPER
jgi:hypothetical protein